MILEKFITIKSVNSNTHNHYKNLGYDVSFKEFVISVNDLPKGSHQIITGICDNCGKEKKQMYKTYLYSTDGTYFCVKCSKLKKNTMKAKYGYEHALQIKKFKEKSANTLFENYGVIHNFKYKEIKDKRDKTMMERYGTINALCNKEIFEKNLKSGLKKKNYKNTNLYYQGTYELNFLELCENNEIIDKVKRGDVIEYEFNNKKLIYFPDFQIKNNLIEIKSTYWYNVHKDKNIAKEKACIEQGYTYVLIIDKDYSKFNDLICD